MSAPSLGCAVRRRVEFVKHFVEHDGVYPGVLVWRPEDPLAVSLLLQTRGQWVFALDLLTVAVDADARVGEGRVRFYPDGDESDELIVELDDDEGRRRVYYVALADVAEFLALVQGRSTADPMVAVDRWLAGVLTS